MSIRAQIAALLWFAVLPLTVLHVRSTYETYQLTLTQASSEAVALADAVATSTEQLLSVAESQMTSVAQHYGQALLDPASCRTMVDALWTTVGYLENLGVFAPNGRGVCSTTGAEDRSDDFSERDWFQAAMGADRMMIAAPRLGSATRVWVVPMSLPLHSPDGTFAGVLMGTLPLGRLQDLLGGVSIGPDEIVTIRTSDNVVVARSRDADAYIGSLATPSPDRTVIDERRWISRQPDFDGTDRTWGGVTLASVGWEAFAGIPTERVQGPALAATTRDWSLNAAIVIVAILFIVSIHKRIVGSLHDLGRGVALASAGRTVEVPEGTPQEVASVVETLNGTLEARDQAEAAERAAKVRFRSILDNAVFGIFMSTPDGRFLDANPALASMLGYDDPDEIIAAGPHAVFASPDEWDELIRTHRDKGIKDLEYQWIAKDGSPVTVRLNGKTVTAEDGKTVFELIVEDITRAKIVDEQLRQTQKMEAIGRLAGGVAHDFNNILTVISLNSDMLMEGVIDGGPARAGLKEIAEATARAEALTGQLLAFSRDEEANAEVLDLNEVVRGLVTMLNRLLTESIRIETMLEPSAPRVFADRGQLEQIIVNLVVNARDAMPEGGCLRLLTFTGVPPAVVDQVDRPWVCVAVEDEGTGMSEETRTHVFEPFFTTKPRGEGSGLGLATAYGIATQMGGHLGVVSEIGKGSRFELWLPSSEKPPRAPRTSSTRQDELTEIGGSETILVAEDEIQIRRVVQRALSHAGYQVLLAEDGVEAMGLVANERIHIDLVVSDVVMPHAQGTDLADFLASHRPEVPILFMSGHIFDLPDRKRIDRHSGAFLAKPFTAAQLLIKVRAVLDSAPRDATGAPVEPPWGS